MIKRTTLLYTFLFALTLSLGGVSFESPANPLVRKGAQKAMETCKKKQGGCLEGAKKAADSFVKKVKSKGKSTKQTPSKTTQQTSHSTKNTKQSDGKSSTKRTKQSDNKNSTKSSNTRPNNATQLNNNRTGDPSSHNQANLPRNSSSNKPTNVSDKAYKKHIDKALPGKKNQVKQVARNIRRDKCKNKTFKQCDVLIDKELEKQNLVKSSNYKRTNSQQPPPKSHHSTIDDASNVTTMANFKPPKKRAGSGGGNGSNGGSGGGSGGSGGSGNLSKSFSGGNPSIIGDPYSPSEVNKRSPKFEELYSSGPSKRKLSNEDAREWYKSKVAAIPQKLDKTQPLKKQAKQAFSLRNKYRTDARSQMTDRITADRLTREEKNLTWDEIFTQKKEKLISQGVNKPTSEQIYKEIIGSSQRSNEEVNRALGL